MRRQERAVQELSEIEEILHDCKDCSMGMIDPEGFPYVVPVNFGYEVIDGHLVFYFHSALVGKKIDSITKNNQVCLTFVSKNQVVSREEDVACTYTTKYASVIANGIAEIINDSDKKMKALNILMKQQTGRDDFQYQEAMLNKVAVYQVTCAEFSGKSSI